MSHSLLLPAISLLLLYHFTFTIVLATLVWFILITCRNHTNLLLLITAATSGVSYNSLGCWFWLSTLSLLVLRSKVGPLYQARMLDDRMEHRWTDKGKRKQKNFDKTFSSATLSTINPTWTTLGLKLGLWGEKQATNHSSLSNFLFRHWSTYLPFNFPLKYLTQQYPFLSSSFLCMHDIIS